MQANDTREKIGAKRFFTNKIRETVLCAKICQKKNLNSGMDLETWRQIDNINQSKGFMKLEL